MTVPSVHCEARKVAYRQSRDGLVVSFVIHPNDMPDALAVAPLGQRYMLALAAIGDDEKPVATTLRYEESFGPPCPWLPVRDARVAITASERGKARYASASDMERARTRAALLPKDARFRGWVTWQRRNNVDGDISAEDMAIKHIQETCCAGESRKLIAEDRACYEAFLRLEAQYLIDTNQMAEPR
jgi:hypothetical protein